VAEIGIDANVSVAVVAAPTEASIEEVLDLAQHILCKEAEAEFGPMDCKYSAFGPERRADFETLVRRLGIPDADITQYLAEWDSFGHPCAIVHGGIPIIVGRPGKGRLN
jgi:hypothetical protein